MTKTQADFYAAAIAAVFRAHSIGSMIHVVPLLPSDPQDWAPHTVSIQLSESTSALLSLLTADRRGA